VCTAGRGGEEDGAAVCAVVGGRHRVGRRGSGGDGEVKGGTERRRAGSPGQLYISVILYFRLSILRILLLSIFSLSFFLKTWQCCLFDRPIWLKLHRFPLTSPRLMIGLAERRAPLPLRHFFPLRNHSMFAARAVLRRRCGFSTPLMHSRLLFSASRITRNKAVSSLNGRSNNDSGVVRKDEDEDGKPEHAVISTFDLFSIGGTFIARAVLAVGHASNYYLWPASWPK
jgi:hypothetical protein